MTGRLKIPCDGRAAAFALIAVVCVAARAGAQITAQARPAPTPPWTKGILPISPESYYNAIKCGKQGGADPPCVFWDTGLCKNQEFALNWRFTFDYPAFAATADVTL